MGQVHNYSLWWKKTQGTGRSNKPKVTQWAMQEQDTGQVSVTTTLRSQSLDAGHHDCGVYSAVSAGLEGPLGLTPITYPCSTATQLFSSAWAKL